MMVNWFYYGNASVGSLWRLGWYSQNPYLLPPVNAFPSIKPQQTCTIVAVTFFFFIIPVTVGDQEFSKRFDCICKAYGVHHAPFGFP